MSSPASRFGLTGKPRAARRSSAADWRGHVGRAALLDAAGSVQVDEQPVGGDLRVLLAERAGAGVARVGVEGEARLLALGVDPGELRLRHEDLAARVERRRLRQAIRNGLDRAQVGRHVLAGRPVAARRALDEAAALVAEGDREAVDLQLRDVAEVRGRLRRRRQAEAAPDARVERPQLVVAERVAERQHRPAVADLVERGADRAADALGRRVGRDQLRMGGLERDELAEELVVLGVAELRGVLLVVEPVRPLDDRHELGVAGDCRIRGQRGGGGDEGLVDGQAVGGLGHPPKDTEIPDSTSLFPAISRRRARRDPSMPAGRR